MLRSRSGFERVCPLAVQGRNHRVHKLSLLRVETDPGVDRFVRPPSEERDHLGSGLNEAHGFAAGYVKNGPAPCQIPQKQAQSLVLSRLLQMRPMRMPGPRGACLTAAV